MLCVIADSQAVDCLIFGKVIATTEFVLFHSHYQTTDPMPNRLADQNSPYLLQHANNPVDWYPWGDAALQKARDLDKPIFLSIGYAACHWCHVMEHESFEDESIAAYLNEHFVSIKVDREERPDLDHIYMQGVMMLREGQGGWPLSAFLTPDQQIFFGGTYWPPHSRQGMPGFDHVLRMVFEAFHYKRDQINEQSAQLTRLLNDSRSQVAEDATAIDDRMLQVAARTLEQSFDFTNGGFGSAPKFPHAMDLQLLLRLASRWTPEQLPARQRMIEMVTLNLDKMARGGIYDHLGGGFARYSVDERWLVPHFEKMLYDNALLVDAYLDAWQLTGHARYANVIRETCDYVLRDLTDPSGGFHCTEDADSEGEEGKFYVWTVEEIQQILGQDLADKFCAVYDVSEIGNFEGHNILNLRRTMSQTANMKSWDLESLEQEIAAAKGKLFAEREKRIRPGKDDKILTSWNGLMIHALARAGQALEEPRYLDAARNAASFLLTKMRKADGRLLRSFRNGVAHLDGYLDDYTYLTNALIELYQIDFESRWLQTAIELSDVVLEKFADPAGGFYFTADDHEQLIARIKEYQDSSIPSGNSMAAYVFARLSALTGSEKYQAAVQTTLQSCSSLLARSPAAFGQMLTVADWLNRPIKQYVIAAKNVEEAQRLLRERSRKFLPGAVFAFAPADASNAETLTSLVQGKKMIDEQASLYVCEGFTCQSPLVGEAAITKCLEQAE
jgi:uncharacterized protein YyaL (SSP411 family)